MSLTEHQYRQYTPAEAEKKILEQTEDLAQRDQALRYWWVRALNAERELHKLKHDLGLD